MQKARAAGAEGLSAVFLFSSVEADNDPFVTGQKGIPSFIMRTLGMRNVVETDAEYPTVS